VVKLSSSANLFVFRKGIANEELAKIEKERGRKRDRNEDPKVYEDSKRMRSASWASISTRVSRSPSPQQSFSNSKQPNPRPYHSRASRSPISLEKKRRRQSISSVDSYSSDERGSAERTSRNTRRRLRHHSPPTRGRQNTSKSPTRRRLSNDRSLASQDAARVSNGRPSPGPHSWNEMEKDREKSLSPFSRRLLLTEELKRSR
jgi:hypothetical protein